MDVTGTVLVSSCFVVWICLLAAPVFATCICRGTQQVARQDTLGGAGFPMRPRVKCCVSCQLYNGFSQPVAVKALAESWRQALGKRNGQEQEGGSEEENAHSSGPL